MNLKPIKDHDLMNQLHIEKQFSIVAVVAVLDAVDVL
jgi:hypothetical protein